MADSKKNKKTRPVLCPEVVFADENNRLKAISQEEKDRKVSTIKAVREDVPTVEIQLEDSKTKKSTRGEDDGR